MDRVGVLNRDGMSAPEYQFAQLPGGEVPVFAGGDRLGELPVGEQRVGRQAVAVTLELPTGDAVVGPHSDRGNLSGLDFAADRGTVHAKSLGGFGGGESFDATADVHHLAGRLGGAQVVTQEGCPFRFGGVRRVDSEARRHAATLDPMHR